MRYILPILLILSLSWSCVSKQTLDIHKVQSVVIDNKSKPLTITLNLQLDNEMRKDVQIITATAALLPQKELRLVLAEPLKIPAGHENVSVSFYLEGFNIFQLPALMQKKVLRAELKADVKIGRRRPMKFKTQMPLNLDELMKTALKNQDYDN